MIARGEGRIVNLTSYAGVRPAPYQSGYGCAKAAVNSLTESLAAELEEHGLSAFSVAPGFTRTEMTEHLTASEAGRQMATRGRQRTRRRRRADGSADRAPRRRCAPTS